MRKYAHRDELDGLVDDSVVVYYFRPLFLCSSVLYAGAGLWPFWIVSGQMLRLSVDVK